jgi:hypothetical protein
MANVVNLNFLIVIPSGRFYKLHLPLASSQNLIKTTDNVILFLQI